MKVPRHTGHDVDDPNRPGFEHFGNCPFCGASVDMRDLGQVMVHAHGQEVQDLTETIPEKLSY